MPATAAATSTPPINRTPAPTVGVVEGGTAGSRTRSGAFASRERSSTTATSPSKTPRRALRFHGGSGVSTVRLGGAARTFLDSSFGGWFFDDSGFNDSGFNG